MVFPFGARQSAQGPRLSERGSPKKQSEMPNLTEFGMTRKTLRLAGKVSGGVNFSIMSIFFCVSLQF